MGREIIVLLIIFAIWIAFCLNVKYAKYKKKKKFEQKKEEIRNSIFMDVSSESYEEITRRITKGDFEIPYMGDSAFCDADDSENF